MSVSLKMVAEKAGVSGATVSRVLNGKELDRIPAATQDRIRQIAAELGYQPNRFARGLRHGRTNTIGLMISGLANPFFAHMIEEAQRQIIGSGYQALLDTGPSVRGSYFQHGSLVDWPVDGMLMWAHSHQSVSMFIERKRADMPVVYLGFERDDKIDAVSFDLRAAGSLAVEHLAERGHDRISYVEPYPFHTRDVPDPRIYGFRDTCSRLGIDGDFFVMQPQEETREAALSTGLAIAALPAAKRPRALFCHNDVIAIGVYHGLRRAGIALPEQIAIVGCDGIEEGRYLDLPLTTVVTPVDELCRAAVQRLMLRLAGDRAPMNPVSIQPKLLAGSTT